MATCSSRQAGTAQRTVLNSNAGGGATISTTWSTFEEGDVLYGQIQSSCSGDTSTTTLSDDPTNNRIHVHNSRAGIDAYYSYSGSGGASYSISGVNWSTYAQPSGYTKKGTVNYFDTDAKSIVFTCDGHKYYFALSWS